MWHAITQLPCARRSCSLPGGRPLLCNRGVHGAGCRSGKAPEAFSRHSREGKSKQHFPVNVSVCSPTWKAAARIGGRSLHFFAGVNVGKLQVSAQEALKLSEARRDAQVIKSRWQNCRSLLIDGVSMLHPSFWIPWKNSHASLEAAAGSCTPT